MRWLGFVFALALASCQCGPVSDRCAALTPCRAAGSFCSADGYCVFADDGGTGGGGGAFDGGAGGGAGGGGGGGGGGSGGSSIQYLGSGPLASSLTAIAPTLPSGLAVGDLLLAFFETHQETVTIANAGGAVWTEVLNSPQGTGGTGANSASRLTVFWSIYSGTQNGPITNSPGDHVAGFISAFRYVSSTNPIQETKGASGSGQVVIPGSATTVARSMIVLAATGEDDVDVFSGWTNVNLVNLTERFQAGHPFGDQGRMVVATGEQAAAGPWGDTGVVLTPPGEVWAGLAIALTPR